MFARILATAALIALPAVAAAQDAPTDPQIAHIAYTAGLIDIKVANLAIHTSHNPEVVAFAQDMVRDHTAVNDQALALLGRLKVTPEDNATSQALNAAADARYAQLQTLSGAAFDKAYVDNEVAYHKIVNSELDTVLIPDAQNPDLKALLQTGLKLFQAHQAHAEMVDRDLK